MIERILNGRKDEGLWIRAEARVEVSKVAKLAPEMRLPESLAYVRSIQLECLKNLKKGEKI